MTDGGKLEVKVKSKRTLKTKLSVTLKQGGEKTGIAKPKKLKLKKGKPLTARFAVKDKAEPLLRSCLETTLKAAADYKVKHGSRPHVLTIPAHRPIKPVYIRALVALVDEVRREA